MFLEHHFHELVFGLLIQGIRCHSGKSHTCQHSGYGVELTVKKLINPFHAKRRNGYGGSSIFLDQSALKGWCGYIYAGLSYTRLAITWYSFRPYGVSFTQSCKMKTRYLCQVKCGNERWWGRAYIIINVPCSTLQLGF